MKSSQRVRELLTKLLAEGEIVLRTRWHPGGNWAGELPSFVDLSAFVTWRARTKLLASLLGRIGKPWQAELTADWNNSLEHAISTQGTLRAIDLSASEGLLLEIEELVLADAFANPLEQAGYLLDQGYFLAAGVILRAVLEERLRRLCDQNALSISKPKPTLNDYNTELYKASICDKITFKEFDVLIAIGNDAAHNNPTLLAENVRQMREGVTRVLQKFSS